MITMLIVAALRRLRPMDDDRRPAPRRGLPMWRLLGGELQHVAGSWMAPRATAAACGVVAAAGVVVALGPTYPGPVAPAVVRWMLAVAMATGSVVLTRSAPPKWGDLRRTVRRARVGLAVVAAAAAVSIVKVGLHEVTPGPVLPGPARWTTAIVVVVAAILLAARHGRASRS